eukprot:g26315.t1
MSCGDGLAASLWQMANAARRLAVQLQQLQPSRGGLLAACFAGSAAILTSASVTALTGPKYRVISVSGDGNCLFRSVAQGAWGEDDIAAREVPRVYLWSSESLRGAQRGSLGRELSLSS